MISFEGRISGTTYTFPNGVSKPTITGDTSDWFSNSVFIAQEDCFVGVSFRVGQVQNTSGTNGYFGIRLETNDVVVGSHVSFIPGSGFTGEQISWFGRLKAGSTVKASINNVMNIPNLQSQNNPSASSFSGYAIAEVQTVRLADLNLGRDPALVFFVFFAGGLFLRAIRRGYGLVRKSFIRGDRE